MAYFDNTDNANFYDYNTNFCTTSTSSEFGACPSLNQTLANEEANIRTTDTFTDGWSVGRQPGYMVGSPRSLRAEASLESAPSVTPYSTQTDGYGQPSFPGHYWPIMGQYAQSYHSGIMSRDNSFASAVASEPSMVVPIPSSAPLDYWGGNENGSSTGTFYMNVSTPPQPSAGLSRTGLMPAWRFRQYEVSRAHPNEDRNIEAGPSTTNPSRGTSEATTDAKRKQTITEEDRAPTTRRPRGMGEPRDHRIRQQRDMRKLCAWAQGWKGLPKLPSNEKALGIALEVVKTIRVPVYLEPHLRKGNTKRTVEGKGAADVEHERRKGTRGLSEELSRYYPLAVDQKAWKCPELLSK
ncbi:hypothetical protein BDM02DRAFT_3120722, partial [Thelephora ganbajun]